jgi:hypothetical protein
MVFFTAFVDRFSLIFPARNRSVRARVLSSGGEFKWPRYLPMNPYLQLHSVTMPKNRLGKGFILLSFPRITLVTLVTPFCTYPPKWVKSVLLDTYAPSIT